jgi:hypothetical protein
MKDNKLTESAGVQTTQNIQSTSSHQLKKFTPDEIFEKIDQLRSGFEPAPSFIEQLLSAGTRDYARAIEEAKISAIKARKDLIDGLRECIRIYVDAHAGDLKVRAIDFVTETFDKIMLHLASVNDKVISGYYDVFLEFVDDIKKKNLPLDMQQTAIESAEKRLKMRVDKSVVSIMKILDNLTEEVIRFSHEIGKG